MNNPKAYALLPKKKYLLIPDELSDGQHQAVVSMEDVGMVKDSLEVWLDEIAEVGDTVEIKCIELTDEEVSKLGDL